MAVSHDVGNHARHMHTIVQLFFFLHGVQCSKVVQPVNRLLDISCSHPEIPFTKLVRKPHRLIICSFSYMFHFYILDHSFNNPM